jgi:hypothetical protein
MGFMVLDPNNDRGHQIDVTPEKGQEYQAVRIFGKDRLAGPQVAVVLTVTVVMLRKKIIWQVNTLN